MAWTSPKTWSASEDLTASEMNTYMRDNQNETAPGIATAASRMIVTDGANSIAERIPTRDYVGTSQTTSSSTFTDLTTTGPAVTVTTGTLALVIVQCVLSSDTAGAISDMGFAVSGASTVAASSTYALRYESSVANDILQASAVFLVTGLTAGSNTFTAKYRAFSGAGTSTYAERFLTVLPF